MCTSTLGAQCNGVTLTHWAVHVPVGQLDLVQRNLGQTCLPWLVLSFCTCSSSTRCAYAYRPQCCALAVASAEPHTLAVLSLSASHTCTSARRQPSAPAQSHTGAAAQQHAFVVDSHITPGPQQLCTLQLILPIHAIGYAKQSLNAKASLRLFRQRDAALQATATHTCAVGASCVQRAQCTVWPHHDVHGPTQS